MTRVVVYLGGWWAGDGVWSGTRIEDCAAVLGPDSDAVYNALDVQLEEKGEARVDTPVGECEAYLPDLVRQYQAYSRHHTKMIEPYSGRPPLEWLEWYRLGDKRPWSWYMSLEV